MPIRTKSCWNGLIGAYGDFIQYFRVEFCVTKFRRKYHFFAFFWAIAHSHDLTEQCTIVNEKKSVALGAVRLSERAAEEYKKALDHFALTRSAFARMCIDCLIGSYQTGREIELPVSFVLGPTRAARRAVEQLGIDIPTFREELAKDIVQISASGEKIAMPGHILTEREREILSRFDKEQAA